MKKKLIMIMLSFFFIIQLSFWNSGNIIQVDSKKTLKELKNNLDDLNEKKINLKEKVELIIQENWKFKSFLKDSLNEEDLWKIKSIISWYNSYSREKEKDLKDNIKNGEDSFEEKKLILINKKDAYKKIIPFIDENKLDDYLDFIKKDLVISKEKWDVNEQIFLNEEIITKKVEKLKEKIEKNKEIIDNKIEKVVKNKIEEKINFLKNSEEFNKLDKDNKKDIILKIIDKIKLKLSLLDNDWQSKINFNKKIEIYKLTLSMLSSFYQELN